MRQLRPLGWFVLTVVLTGLVACSKVQPPTAEAGSARTTAVEERLAERKSVVVARKDGSGDQGENKAGEGTETVLEDLNPLHFEVEALETMYQLQLTREQIERLAQLARSTSRKRQPGRAIRVSKEFHKTLTDLHAALVADDDEKIAAESGAFDALREKESPDFEEAEITSEARRHVPEFLRTLGPRQVAVYLSEFADEFPDPFEKLADALEEVRKAPGKEGQDLRDGVAMQVGWLVGGLDVAAEKRVREKVVALLDRAVQIKDDQQFEAQRPELERAARDLIAGVGPTDVLRHFVERSLAELLSNPRLEAAAQARLKQS
jgi:hypothetical protein